MIPPLRKLAVQHRRVAQCQELVRQLGETFFKLRGMNDTASVSRLIVLNLETSRIAADKLNIATSHLNFERAFVRKAVDNALRIQDRRGHGTVNTASVTK
jgi:hypothetical protein